MNWLVVATVSRATLKKPLKKPKRLSKAEARKATLSAAIGGEKFMSTAVCRKNETVPVWFDNPAFDEMDLPRIHRR